MRYRLRTLLILLAVGPVLLAGTWFAGTGGAKRPTTRTSYWECEAPAEPRRG